jgi:hypothetical protein
MAEEEHIDREVMERRPEDLEQLDVVSLADTRRDAGEIEKEIESGTYTPRMLWKIPISFLPEFNRDPLKSKRDLGAEPTRTIQAYYPDPFIASKRVNLDREPPWDDTTKRFKEWFKCTNKAYPRFIHVDLAQKKDACGIAMGYRSGYTTVDGEMRPKVYLDVMIRIQAPNKGEIMFTDVRQIIYTLQDLGFPIGQVSFDGWQSVDSIQILRTRGINATMLSVDRTIEPHETLKSCLQDNRLNYYRYTVLDKAGTPDEKLRNIFEDEISSLELLEGKKVDHAAKSSKDVADAIAGMCYWCVQEEINASVNPMITLI